MSYGGGYSGGYPGSGSGYGGRSPNPHGGQGQWNGQPSYSQPQPYYTQHHQQQHYQQPPPPQHQQQQQSMSAHPYQEGFRFPLQVATDQHEFRRFLMFQLRNLTFNSKPMITNLTLFAHEHLVRMSAVMASCLEEHLRNCPPPHRLPSFYLLDSICKNIGPPYISLFRRFVERVFLSSYHLVDPATKIKMEELLGTWRTGGPQGTELWADDGRTQAGIERALFGKGGLSGHREDQSEGYANGEQNADRLERENEQVNQVKALATPVERSGVLMDVRRILSMRQDQANHNASDANNLRQIDALRKLEALVLDTHLTSEQVTQIRTQLAELAPPPPPPASVAPPPSDPSATGGIDPNLLAALGGTGGLAGLLAAVQQKAATPEPSPAPISAGAAGPGVAASEEEYDPMRANFEDEVINFGLRLIPADILKPSPEVDTFLTARLQLQCKQCGLRFFDSPLGKSHMDSHLDWHFTHKRRIREGASRTQGRSWSMPVSEWIISDTIDPLFDAAEEAHKKVVREKVDREELLKRKVKAPDDLNELEELSCPVCKEKFKSEWSDEDEEWVLGNAEMSDGVIFHATCLAETAPTTTAQKLASIKLSEGSLAPSREGTPGIKRKIEDGDGESDGGDSSKKIKSEP